ncbi:hypothetical protein PTKIN_Ptkin15bG0023300 [Pterospermum kingtungense]
MSLAARALHLFDRSPSLFSLFDEEHELSLAFDVFEPSSTLFTPFLSPFHHLPVEAVSDVTHLLETPFSWYCRRIRATDELELCSGALLGRISGFKFGADRFEECDRKYTWKAEIKSSDKSEANRKYQYTTEIKGLEGKKCEWTAEIESPERNGSSRKYKWTAEINGKNKGNLAKNKKEVPLKIKELGSHEETCSGSKQKMKVDSSTRVVEIEEPDDHAAMLLRQAFGMRAGAVSRLRGKRKILSPDEAALLIERSFRAYLIRRSKSLRSLRELAVAKAKLKEIRSLFNNYSYRQRIDRDSEELKRFSERIISLILAVDAIEVV